MHYLNVLKIITTRNVMLYNKIIIVFFFATLPFLPQFETWCSSFIFHTPFLCPFHGYISFFFCRVIHFGWVMAFYNFFRIHLFCQIAVLGKLFQRVDLKGSLIDSTRLEQKKNWAFIYDFFSGPLMTDSCQNQ